MGNCMSSNKFPVNRFYMIGDKGLGIVQVTETELIYMDRCTASIWRWPLKFLRVYHWDGEGFQL